jgi:ribulose-5-phosphate 4-epimerase/fuculose-1-phosphate aldolase
VEFTIVGDIKRVPLDATSDDLDSGYILPGEWPIHSELYRARPDVGAVVHGHPRSSLLCGVMNLPLRPIVGAYDPGMLDLAVRGVPVYPSSVLISTVELGQQVARRMVGADACMLRGHGVAVAGVNVQDATVRTIRLEGLADLTLRTNSVLGAEPIELDDEEIKEVGGYVSNSIQRYASWVFDYYRHVLGDRADVSRRN